MSRHAAAALETPVAETVFHFEEFARDSADPSRRGDFCVLVGLVEETFEEAAALPVSQRADVLYPASYVASRDYAKQVSAADGNGVAYPSLRHSGGKCLGAFRPRAVGIPRQERHLKYRWNGEPMDRYFDFGRHEWIDL